MRVEAADRGEQALAPQHLVQAGDAAGEPVGSVEERGVGVGDLDARAQQRRRHGALFRGGLTGVQQLDGLPGPHGPVSQQAADDAALDRASRRCESERGHEVRDDGIVVAGVQRDVVATGVDDGADDVERLVAIERRDLDGDDARDLGEAAPERVAQRTAAYRRLQVEADDRQPLRHARGNGR